MKLKKFIITAAIALFGVWTGVFAEEAIPEVKNIVATGVGETNISVRVLESGGEVYVSADDVLKGSGYELGWESYHSAVIVYNPQLKCNMYIYLKENKIYDGRDFIYYDKPIVINGNLAYITEKMLADLTKDGFIYEIKAPVVEDITDKFRRQGDVKVYNGMYLLGGWFAFEKVALTDEMVLDYANAVNTVASSLPENVQVYNMTIPNSCEYYAPKMYSTNLKAQYEKLYSALDERVKAVDIYQTLFDKADEFIFFNTDHHWTQRGAYFAYKKFAELAGVEIPVSHMDSCQKLHSYNVVGSFAGIMKGTEGETQLNSAGEVLERFVPPYDITKLVYSDCLMEKCMGQGPMINKYLRAYGTFMGGDVPVAQLHNKNLSNGKVLCIIKDSYANAFATWAICDYEYVYLVDIRCFNGANGMEEPFSIKTFQEKTGFQDLLIMHYPNTIYDYVLRDYIRKLA